MVLNNLGNDLLMQDRTEEAMPLIDEAVARCREHFGPNHPISAKMLSNLGHAHARAGELERHIELLTTLDQLGTAYALLGRHEQARAALERGVNIGERELGR